MSYIPKIDDYLKILAVEEAKNFEYFKSIREDNNRRKLAQLLYIFLTTPDEVEKYVQSRSTDNCIYYYNVKILNIFDPKLQLINTKPMIKNKLKNTVL